MNRVSTNRKTSAPTSVPREHGAWFMLGHCLLIGAAVSGSFGIPVLLVICASVLVFMAMQGLKQIARAFRQREHQIPVRIPWASIGFLLAAAFAGTTAMVGWNLYVLFLWGAISLILTVIYTWVLFRRRERSVFGEWLGILGLTLSAGAVWTVGNRGWGVEALLLWGLAFMYFGGTVPYVKLRVKQMKEPADSFSHKLNLAGPALLYAFMTLLIVVLGEWMGWVPALAIVPFGLSLAKVTWYAFRGEGPKRIAHVGYSEAGFSTVFAVVTIAAFLP